ncbi:MAG: zf-TFIIB domain-containing protein, partial [Flavobacterium sp.]|nr:zf-TFIIB domain-containing protein [Flavobacterium sp.]
MKCPNCSVNLVMSDRNGVEIDYCPECRGVWLDRGELDKIIERSVITTPGFKDKDYGHHDKHYGGQQGDYYKKKRKDSFLGDLFDF